MSPESIGWLSIVALFVLLALRMPVAFAMAIVGFFGYMAISGLPAALFVIGQMPYARVATYAFTVIPLFIMMGHFASQAGFVTDIFNAARKWLGGWPGGLVQATVAGSAAFGAACGSGIAGCAVVGKTTIPEMLRHGVQRKLAFGAVAVAGPLSVMIPPSMVMVIYGIITEQSIGKLLIAGIIPGIVAALVFMAQIYIRVKLNPSLAPPLKEVVTWKERLKSLKGVWGIALVAITIMGGIYTGVFTPTESGAVGVFLTFLMALASGKLKWFELKNGLLETAETTGMIFLILASAAIFGYLLAISRIPTEISGFIIGLQVSRWWVIIGIMVLYFIMGTFIDMTSAFILTLPILFPSVVALGFEPIWFGVLVVFQSEVALITPPFALNIFVLRGLFPDTSMGDIMRGIGPFLLTHVLILAIFIVFPQLSLWLPSMMG